MCHTRVVFKASDRKMVLACHSMKVGSTGHTGYKSTDYTSYSRNCRYIYVLIVVIELCIKLPLEEIVRPVLTRLEKTRADSSAGVQDSRTNVCDVVSVNAKPCSFAVKQY